MAYTYEDHPSLFEKGKKLAQGRGLDKMMDKAYKNKWTYKNSIVERDDFNGKDFFELDDTNWRIYERQRIQYGKPASETHKTAYNQTAIARDINNVKKRRG